MPPAPLTPAARQHLKARLFANPELLTYAVLDGASIEGLLPALAEHDPPYECLYRGELEPDLAEAAPYLVQLPTPDHPFVDYVLGGWGHHWGIYALTPVPLGTLRRHFRRFLLVKDPDGRQLYFRYYDPRVLSVFLPTCNPDELAVVRGPVSVFLCEKDTGQDCLLFYREKQLTVSLT